MTSAIVNTLNLYSNAIKELQSKFTVQGIKIENQVPSKKEITKLFQDPKETNNLTQVKKVKKKKNGKSNSNAVLFSAKSKLRSLLDKSQMVKQFGLTKVVNAALRYNKDNNVELLPIAKKLRSINDDNLNDRSERKSVRIREDNFKYLIELCEQQVVPNRDTTLRLVVFNFLTSLSEEKQLEVLLK